MPNLQLALLKALGAFAVLVLCCGGSYYYGGKNARNADAADHLAGVNAAIAAGRLQAQAESAIAIQEAAKQEQSRNVRRAATSALDTELARHEKDACSLDPASYQRLLDTATAAGAVDPAPATDAEHGAITAPGKAPQPEGDGFGVKLRPPPRPLR
jgi:hypothetical protein